MYPPRVVNTLGVKKPLEDYGMAPFRGCNIYIFVYSGDDP
jgi:hypothetical protein